jgi:NhaA family Na+:H+ antiporter
MLFHGPRRAWKYVLDHSLLLLFGAIVALVWANASHDSYGRVVDTLRFPVNEVAMAFFFALAVKEIVEAVLPGGALAARGDASIPVLAAIGGMAAPAALFAIQVALQGRPELAPGWAIPCATDIAFSYLAARLVFPKDHPAIPFLLLLAVADDALGLVLLATFYPTGDLALLPLAGLVLPAMGIAWWLRRRGVQSWWPYILVAGTLSWIGFHQGGLHSALALVPIVPFLPHARRDEGVFAEGETAKRDTLNVFARALQLPVQIVLGLFGLVNAGVALSSTGPVTWMVVSSLLIGKPLGIVIATVVAGRLILRRPSLLSLRETIVTGIIAGIGFTVALFFATAAFPPGDLLDQAKMGALLSFLAMPLGVLAARVLRVGTRQGKPIGVRASPTS